MKAVPGGDFEPAWRDRLTLTIDDVEIQTVSRAQLIALKRASGRPQDLVDADTLRSWSHKT